jgi:hypothetical protein
MKLIFVPDANRLPLIGKLNRGSGSVVVGIDDGAGSRAVEPLGASCGGFVGIITGNLGDLKWEV